MIDRRVRATDPYINRQLPEKPTINTETIGINFYTVE